MTAFNRGALLVFVLCCLTKAYAGSRSSANYSFLTDINDLAGRLAASGNYSNLGSVGQLSSISGISAPAETSKSGYIGQLYDIVALSISAPPSSNLNEAASRQLNAAALLDDNTTLAPLNSSTVTWSIVSGPLSSISAAGVATASAVYQDSPAIVGGAAQGLTGQLTITILNVDNDNFGSYAGDGLDDAWQVQYFGLNNPKAAPTADPDGDGQNNLFEYIAGLVPTDPTSVFRVSVAPVPGQASQKRLTISPIVSGRTYTPFTNSGLAPANWVPLTGYMQSDNGTVRMVTDTGATATAKFYRVQISLP